MHGEALDRLGLRRVRDEGKCDQAVSAGHQELNPPPPRVDNVCVASSYRALGPHKMQRKEEECKLKSEGAAGVVRGNVRVWDQRAKGSFLGSGHGGP